VGFVEGHDIFSDKVDVVVTDGFTGNVALKTMEGAAKLNLRHAAYGVHAQFRSQIARPAAARARRFARGLDPRRYNGATMVG